MNLIEVRILNSLKNLGITSEQFTSLQEIEDDYVKNQKTIPGVKYLFKIQNFLIGLRSVHGDTDFIVKEPKKHPKPFPFFSILERYTSLNIEDMPEVVSYFFAYNEDDNNPKPFVIPSKNRPFIKDIGALKEYLIINLKDFTKSVYSSDEISFIYWLFNKDYSDLEKKRINIELSKMNKEKEKKVKVWAGMRYVDVEQYHNKQKILEVFEKDNFRYSIITDNGTDTTDLMNLNFHKHNSAEYIFIDKDRIVCSNLYLDFDMVKASTKELNIYGIPNSPLRLTKEMFLNAPLEIREQLMAERLTREKEIEDEETHYNNHDFDYKQYNLCDFKRNNIYFKPDKIFFEEFVLSGVKIKSFLDKTDYKYNNDLVFSKVFEDYTNFVNASFLSNGKFSGMLGKFKVSMQKKVNNNREFFYINQRLINKFDLKGVIRKTLQFNNVKNYNAFLDRIVGTNLDVIDIIDDGLSIEVHNETVDELSDLSIPPSKLLLKICREKNRNFLIVGNKKLVISDTSKLISLRHSSRWAETRSMSFIVKTIFECVKDIIPSDFGVIVQEAVKNQREKERKERLLVKEKIVRSKEFLQKAIDIVKPEIKKTGYVINAKSGRKYFLKSKDCKTYEMKNDKSFRFICIDRIDKQIDLKDKSLVNDVLAGRLHTLANDVDFASQIHTLQLGSEV